MSRVPDKKARRELRESLLPQTLRIVGRAIGMPELVHTFREVDVLGPTPAAERKAAASASVDSAIAIAIDLADRVAVAALNYDSVLEERGREAKRAEKQKQRESDALAKNNRKTLRGDFDAGPESTFS